ncbi:hypothetical protein BD769DRAFT_1702283 [Suillus cothurnatus]|nr:hypothetical protein BD769DRAFT_1702283 [Suillus cothurnatus]
MSGDIYVFSIAEAESVLGPWLPFWVSSDSSGLLGELSSYSISDESSEQFSGTGGVGNIRRSSVSSDSRPFDGPDDYDLTHGRELAVYPDRDGASGRRPPSPEDYFQTATMLNERTTIQTEYEQQVKKHDVESNPIRTFKKLTPASTIWTKRKEGCILVVKRYTHLAEAESQTLQMCTHHGGFESAWCGGAGNLRSNSATRDPSGRRPPRDAKVQSSAALQSQGGSYVFHALHKQARLPAPARLPVLSELLR